MSADLPGHSAPAVGFEVPLEMLAACHLRIERQLATLQRLIDHLRVHGANGDARSASAGLLRYFDGAAPQHHADEEVDLFPALLESMAGSDAVCLRELTQSLSADHRQLEQCWQRLREPLAALAAGATATLDEQAVADFIDGYRRHLAREDAELLPMATRLIGDAELDHIGRAMRARRGLLD